MCVFTSTASVLGQRLQIQESVQCASPNSHKLQCSTLPNWWPFHNCFNSVTRVWQPRLVAVMHHTISQHQLFTRCFSCNSISLICLCGSELSSFAFSAPPWPKGSRRHCTSKQPQKEQGWWALPPIDHHAEPARTTSWPPASIFESFQLCHRWFSRLPHLLFIARRRCFGFQAARSFSVASFRCDLVCSKGAGPNFRPFFPCPAPIFALLLSLWGVFWWNFGGV